MAQEQDLCDRSICGAHFEDIQSIAATDRERIFDCKQYDNGIECQDRTNVIGHGQLYERYSQSWW